MGFMGEEAGKDLICFGAEAGEEGGTPTRVQQRRGEVPDYVLQEKVQPRGSRRGPRRSGWEMGQVCAVVTSDSAAPAAVPPHTCTFPTSQPNHIVILFSSYYYGSVAASHSWAMELTRYVVRFALLST